VGHKAVESAVCGVVVVLVAVVVEARDEVVEVDGCVVVLVVTGLLLPHAATTIANTNTTEPAIRRVRKVIQRMVVQRTITG
jgi:hypothetical protein